MQAFNLLIDGNIFYEGRNQIKNKYGMLRVADNITKGLASKEINVAILNEENTYKSDIYIKEYFKASGINNEISIINNYYISKLYQFPFINRLIKLKSNRKFIEKFEVFHSFYHPFPENIKTKNKTITLLDIIPLRMKGYDKSIVNKTQKILNCVRDNYAICISDFTKKDVLEYDSTLKEHKIFSVPLAYDPNIFYHQYDEDKLQLVKTKYNIPSNYILTLSSKDKRKNVETLIKSFNQFVDRYPKEDLNLYIAGNFSYTSQILENLKISTKTKSRIFFSPVFINEEDLSLIYSHAMMFGFLSLYEGFGLPVLEAMATRCPVFCSDNTSLPEITGDAALLVNPLNEEEAFNAITSYYFSPELRLLNAQKGYEKASKFNWDNTCKKYLDIFNQII